MAKFTVHHHLPDYDYEVDTDRPFGGYEAGDILCKIAPFFGIPLTLYLGIRKDGSLIFRSWQWGNNGNGYLHLQGGDFDVQHCDYHPTQEQKDTVSGLFSGRIEWEGLKFPVGATLQKVCPVDVEREEQLLGRKIIFLA